MATTTLTMSVQKVTVPANTDEHELNFNSLLVGKYGSAYFEWISGTSIQVNTSGIAITSDTGALASGQPRLFQQIIKGTNIRYKGGAGGEVFQVSIYNE